LNRGRRQLLGRRLFLIECKRMPKQLTADDILPLVAALTPRERARLLRFMASTRGDDVSVYRMLPPSVDEFSTDEEPLAWEAEGWEDVA